MLEDQELVKRTLQGEEGAFNTLVSEHRKKIFYHCLSVVKDTEIAEDLTQETFLHAYQHLDAFQGKAQFSTWLWRISHNLCLNYLKKHKERTYPLKEEIFVAQDEWIEDPEQMEQLRAVLELLPEKQRIVFELYVFEQIPQKEIAARLNIPHGTVRSRLHNARKKLRESMG